MADRIREFQGRGCYNERVDDAAPVPFTLSDRPRRRVTVCRWLAADDRAAAPTPERRAPDATADAVHPLSVDCVRGTAHLSDPRPGFQQRVHADILLGIGG